MTHAITQDEAFKIANRLSFLRFYPQNPAGIAEIAATIWDMCDSPESAEGLVHHVKLNYDEWTGTRTLRAIYCQRYKPLDGHEVYGAQRNREDAA